MVVQPRSGIAVRACPDHLPNPRRDQTDNLGFATVKGVPPTPRRILAAWLVVAVLGLAACDDEPDPSADGSDPPSSGTPSSSTPSTSEPTESGTPTVEPAAGIELREQTSSIRVPEGWIASEPLVSYQSGARGPRGAGNISLIDDETLNPGTSLEVRVDSAIKTLPKDATYLRLDDVMLGDTVAYHLSYTTEGSNAVNDLVETERNGRLITINFSLAPKALRDNPNLVASVLATFQWV